MFLQVAALGAQLPGTSGSDADGEVHLEVPFAQTAHEKVLVPSATAQSGPTSVINVDELPCRHPST